jgi:hypothetical protein
MNTHFRWTALLLMGLASGLAGCGGGGSGGCSSLATGSVGSLLCGSASNNRAPVAAVSAPSSATVGTALTLDGTGSSDPDGQSVTFRWEITAKPAGSLAALSDSTAARPVFTPDVVGTYTVRLIVNDGRSDSAPVTFSTSARRLNNAPVAHAGDDVTAVNGTEVFLNGLASSDPDGDPITYRWSLVARPAGSTASLSGADTPRPFFTPDVGGNYVLSLVTHDGTLSSSTAFVTVISGAANVAPTAVAVGPSSVVLVGTRVTLDGSASADPNGDLLRYVWRWISRPLGSQAVLGFGSTARPEFVPDLAGDYVVGLVVNDGRVNSSERGVTVRAASSATPVVNAGSTQSVLVGSTIDLDGSGAAAGAGAQGNAALLTYLWTVVSRPEGGSPSNTITNGGSAKARFIPDVVGTYVFRLTVTDSQGNAASDVVSVRVSQRNAPPVAQAGGDRNALLGETVVLDGSRSTDANPGDVLTYTWQLISSPTSPQASTAKLSPAANPAGTQATGKLVAITPDQPGTYVVGLVVRDGTDSSEMSLATITVRAANQVPRAKITGPATGKVGDVLKFDGLSSTDDGPVQLLTYTWRLELANAPVALREPRLAIQTFSLSQPGQYVIRLKVSDGVFESTEDAYVFTVNP